MRFAAVLAVLTIIFGPSPAYSVNPAQLDIEVEPVSGFAAGAPRFLAVDEAAGRIYTTQLDGTVKVFDLEGGPVMTIEGRAADGTRVLRRPTGIALYKDRIYVADEGLNAVSIFNKDGSFIESFGSGGSGPKEFRTPQGIRVDQSLVYVADQGNGRIQVFGLDGVYITSFGNEGGEKDRLKVPVDLALAPNGDIYVTDNWSQNIKIFGPDHKLKSTAERVAYPFSIALYGDGFLATDSREAYVTMHNFRGDLLLAFGGKGIERDMFQSMAGIYLTASLHVYIADTDSGLVRIVRLGKVDPAAERQYPPPTSVGWVRDIGMSVGRVFWDERDRVLYAVDNDAVLRIKDGGPQKRFKVSGWQPSGMAVDPDGALWVSDRRRNRLVKLGPDGGPLKEIGSPGSEEGRLSGPEDIAISKKGVIYVADSGNERVQQFNTDGVFIRVLGKGGTSSYFKRPVSLALDHEGILYVLDAKRREVLVFSPNGLPLNEVGKDEKGKLLLDEPVDLAVNGEEVFVLDAGHRQVLVFDRKGAYVRRFGAPGSRKGDLKNPRSIDAVGMTRLMVADTGNGRIQELSIVYTPGVVQNPEANAGMREVSITWRPSPEAYVDRYVIYRGASQDGSYRAVAEATGTEYTDPGLEPGQTYYYRVAATAPDGNEGRGSQPVSAVPKKFTPAQPQGVSAEPGEDSIRLMWRQSGGPLVTGYVVYRRTPDGPAVKVGETEGPEFIDSGLNSNTSFTYLVAARSIDGEESTPAQVQATTQIAGGSPLKVEVVRLDDVLSNAYRLYESGGMGRVRLRNTADAAITEISVLYRVDEFMDAPAVLQVEALPPGGERELVLKPMFNDKIRDVAENVPVTVELTAAYVLGGQQIKQTMSRTVTIYDRHHTTWDEDGRIATFITPDDPVVQEFVRSLASQFDDTSEPLVLGGMLFDALGTVGVTYTPGPENPYRLTSGQSGFVDRVQYPRETLRRKGGDTDELVGLYAATLESMGLPTRVALYPGHMFMMFSIGFVSETGGLDLDGRLVHLDGRVWVPVEATLMGTSFLTAWEKGSAAYREWEGRGLRVLDLRAAWERFGPADLQDTGWKPPLVVREQTVQRFPADFITLVRSWLKLRTSGYAAALKKNTRDAHAMLQTGIVYAEAGETADAARLFERAHELDPTSAALKNNLGNMLFLEGTFEKACKLYQDAASLDGGDPMVLVNLARCLMRIERYREAEDAFRRAYELDRSISRAHPAMSLKLLGGF